LAREITPLAGRRPFLGGQPRRERCGRPPAAGCNGRDAAGGEFSTGGSRARSAAGGQRGADVALDRRRQRRSRRATAVTRGGPRFFYGSWSSTLAPPPNGCGPR